MGLQALGINTGVTSFTVTGGTPKTYSPNGATVPNGLQLIDPLITDFRVRPTVTATVRYPVKNSDGSFSKDKRVIKLVQPKILADGSIAFNLIEIRTELHPESTDAEGTDLRYQGAQLLFDSDAVNFWKAGSLA